MMTTQISLPFLAQGPDGVINFELALTRSKFEQLTEDLIDSTLEPVRKALSDAKLKASDIDKVLLVGDETVTIGAPYVEGATVEATVEKQGKERKVTIYKYNAKKHYHKKQGHRQPYTKLIVDSINVK